MLCGPDAPRREWTVGCSRRENKRSRQIVLEGEKLDASAVGRVRDQYLPRGLGPGAVEELLIANCELEIEERVSTSHEMW